MDGRGGRDRTPKTQFASRFANGRGPRSGEAGYAPLLLIGDGVSTKAGGCADRIEVKMVARQDGIAKRLAMQQMAGTGTTWTKSEPTASNRADSGLIPGGCTAVLPTASQSEN